MSMADCRPGANSLVLTIESSWSGPLKMSERTRKLVDITCRFVIRMSMS
jgi:hypothetical protein